MIDAFLRTERERATLSFLVSLLGAAKTESFVSAIWRSKFRAIGRWRENASRVRTRVPSTYVRKTRSRVFKSRRTRISCCSISLSALRPLRFSLEFPLKFHFNHYGFIDEKKLNTASFTLKRRPLRARWKIRLMSVVPKVLRSSCFFLAKYNVASVL